MKKVITFVLCGVVTGAAGMLGSYLMSSAIQSANDPYKQAQRRRTMRNIKQRFSRKREGVL